MESNPQLSIELVWQDVDLEELCISAYNGSYCGTAKVYFAQGDVARLVESIRGFPRTISQQEVFEAEVMRSAPWQNLSSVALMARATQQYALVWLNR
jgi:hypothetical protein